MGKALLTQGLLRSWQLAWRHEDIALSNYGFYRGTGTELGLSDPVFVKRLSQVGINAAKDPKAAGRHWIDQVWHGKAFSWADIPAIREKWRKISGGKPFLLKGIQNVEDAKRAVECGCEGLVVSNHAGRQVDGAVGSLDVLKDVVDAVGDKVGSFLLLWACLHTAYNFPPTTARGSLRQWCPGEFAHFLECTDKHADNGHCREEPMSSRPLPLAQSAS